MARSTFTGPINSLTKETDGGLWIAAKYWSFYTAGTWTDTRAAAGDYNMTKTAAATTGQAVVFISDHLIQKIGADPATAGQTHDVRGIEVVSLDLVYSIATAALVAHTYALQEVTYANAVANAVAAAGGTITGTLATATQANPYVTNLSLGTAKVLGTNVVDRELTLEITANAALTSVLLYMGCYVRFNYNLL